MTRTLRLVLFLGCLILLLAPFVAAVDTETSSDGSPAQKETTPATTDDGQGNGTMCTNCPSDLGGSTFSISENGSLIASTNEKKITINLGIDFLVKAIAWDPTNSYALIIGENGIIVKLTVEGQITTIASGTSEDLWLISWKPVQGAPAGTSERSMDASYQMNYALILGQNGTVLKWDGERIIHIMDDAGNSLEGLDWSESGDFALIKGKDGKVFRYPPETDSAPFIVINEPTEGAVSSNMVTVRGMAVDPDGTVIAVDIRLDDGAWHHADGTNRWSYRMDLSGAQNGPHTIYARAYDGTVYYAVNVQIDVENDLLPTVTILYPTAGQVMPVKDQIIGTASDPEGQLDSVWVKVDEGILFKATGTDTWRYEFEPAFYGAGVHIITAMAFDGVQYSEASYTTVVVGQQANDPYAIIVSPIDGRSYMTTEKVQLRAVADDFAGDQLTFTWESSIDGQLGTGDMVAKGLSAGHHQISVTVSDGTLEATDTVSIEVADASDAPPTLVFLGPKESSTVKGQTTITGGADDDQKVVAIKVRVDSGTWRTLPGGKVWYYEWDTTTAQDGQHAVTAMAFDGRQWSKPASLKLFVDNGKGPRAAVPPAPKTPERDIQGPRTGGLDGKTATAVAVATTVLTVAILIGLVESLKVKFLSIFLVPLYSRIKKDEVLDNFTRGAIFGFIVANPGAHYNLIKQELMLNNGAIIYHLDILERKGYISSEKAGIFKKYYPKGFKKEGGILETLTDLQRRIFHEIKANPGVSQKEIAGLMNITARALNYHIKTLLKSQLILLERVGRRTLCFITETVHGPGETEKATGQ